MKCFNDKNGEQWTIDLNIGTARRVKAECDVDLVNVIVFNDKGADTTVLQQLSEDAYMLVNVLYSLCKSQIAQKGMDEEAFAERFDADTIGRAVDALVQEVINFSQPAKRKMLTLIYDKTRSFRARAEQHLESLLNSEEFDRELEEQLSKSLTNTQESSE